MKTRVVLVLLTVALLFFQWNTDTVTRQGLYWGLRVDDRLECTLAYSLRSENGNEMFEADVYIRVSSLPVIPDSIGCWDDLRFPGCRVSFANDTPLDVRSYPELASILSALCARPVGNWSLMSSLLVGRFAAIPGVSSYSIKDDDRFWGYEYSIKREGSGYASSAYYSDSWYRNDGTYSYGSWRWNSNWSADGISWHYSAFALVLQRSDALIADQTPVPILLAAVFASVGILVIERRVRAGERSGSDERVTYGCTVSWQSRLPSQSGPQ